MPVIGVQFNEINAKKEGTVRPGLKINSTPNIIDVKEMKLDSLTKGATAIVIEFEFVSKYEPNVATIKIKGEVLYLTEKPEEAIKEWKKKKALPEPILLEVLNTLFRKCLSKILILSDDMQLPSPVPMPIVSPQDQEKRDETKYIG